MAVLEPASHSYTSAVAKLRYNHTLPYEQKAIKVSSKKECTKKTAQIKDNSWLSPVTHKMYLQRHSMQSIVELMATSAEHNATGLSYHCRIARMEGSSSESKLLCS